jgi:putative transposase
MMGAVHLLPGTTFSDVNQKGCYPSEARAILTLSELERWLALQIAGVYQLSLHSSLGKTPLTAWQEAVSRLASLVRKPVDPTEFFLSFLPAVSRQVRRDGIHLWNIRYWDNVLSPWAGRMQRPLLVKYDPRDLSRIYVRDPDGLHWPVPYADLGQPPIALWELQEANRRIRKSTRSVPNQRSIFVSILAQRRVVQQAATSSRQRRRHEKTPPSEGPLLPLPEKTKASLRPKRSNLFLLNSGRVSDGRRSEPPSAAVSRSSPAFERGTHPLATAGTLDSVSSCRTHSRTPDRSRRLSTA